MAEFEREKGAHAPKRRRAPRAPAYTQWSGEGFRVQIRDHSGRRADQRSLQTGDLVEAAEKMKPIVEELLEAGTIRSDHGAALHYLGGEKTQRLDKTAHESAGRQARRGRMVASNRIIGSHIVEHAPRTGGSGMPARLLFFLPPPRRSLINKIAAGKLRKKSYQAAEDYFVPRWAASSEQ